MGLPQAAAGEDILAREARPRLDYLVEEKVSSAHAPREHMLHGALVLAEPAAGEDLLARKPTRIVGSKKDGNRRDIAGLPDTAKRRLSDQGFLEVSAEEARSCALPSVSTIPGLMVLTRIFFGPNSRASTPVMASTAPLVPV